MKKIILFGGTFDPIHNGHIRIARYASNALDAEVIFVPSKNPRWKAPCADIEDRLNMLKLAIKGQKSCSISDYEVKSNAEVNYTIDTVRYFVDKYKGNQILLLIGADQVESFHKWKDADEIAKLAQIIYVERPNIKVNNENINRFKMQSLKFDKSGTVSSSAVRSLKELDISKEVIDYIAEHHLYYIKDLEAYYESKRFLHAQSVANVAYNIATNNSRGDANECYIAGLLHDLGKKVNEDKMKEIMNQYYQEYVNSLPRTLYHQFVGEYLAKTIFHIDNLDILDSIKFHATGKDNMCDMGKIIYSADKIDPLRGYDSEGLIQSCYKNFDKGFLEVLAANREHLVKNKLSFDNPLTKACMDMYLDGKK